MTAGQFPTEISPASRLLIAAEFHRLADVPHEVEWFANLTNPSTRRAYENAVGDFMRFARITGPEEFRVVTSIGMGSLALPHPALCVYSVAR